MATSSIIENIRVNNPKLLEYYVEAMEASAHDFHPRTEDEKSGVITDSNRIRNIVSKALARKDIKA